MTIEEKAEKLRQEPYRLFTNDCLTKSLRLIKMCREQGVKAKLVWCVLGLISIRLPVIGRIPLVEFIHFWVDVEGKRIETSRPLGSEGLLGIVPSQIKPVITIIFHFW